MWRGMLLISIRSITTIVVPGSKMLVVLPDFIQPWLNGSVDHLLIELAPTRHGEALLIVVRQRDLIFIFSYKEDYLFWIGLGLLGQKHMCFLWPS